MHVQKLRNGSDLLAKCPDRQTRDGLLRRSLQGVTIDRCLIDTRSAAAAEQRGKDNGRMQSHIASASSPAMPSTMHRPERRRWSAPH